MKSHFKLTVIILGLVFCFLSNPSANADSKVENWVQFNQTLSLTDSLQFFSEIQPRISLSEGELATFIARLAPIYVINPHHSIGGGFGWQQSFSPSAVNETRLYLQYAFNHGVGSSSFTHRFRAEHRALSSTGDKAYRMRYQIRTLHPWFSSQAIKALLSNELFFNLNTTAVAGPVSGFDQNRFIAGINYQWSKNLNSDIGYMFNYVRKPRSTEDRNNHIFYYCLNATF